MARPPAAHVSVVAWILAGVAGYVDALAFLLLGGVFVSHTTGDTAHIGHAVAREHWAEALRFAWPVAMFLVGLFTSAIITTAGKRRGFHSTFGVALGIEAVLLFVSPLITSYRALTVLLAGSMGIQTLTVTTVSGLRIFTTYMTGNLAKFAEGAERYFFSGDRLELRHSVVTAMLWVCFFSGIVSGAAAERKWGRAAALAPAAVMAVIAALDFRRPIDPAEEIQG